jgi:hypothetical protein
MSERILLLISDQKPDDIGHYAGWGSGDDLNANPDPEDPRTSGLSTGSFGGSPIRYSLGAILIPLYIPATIVLILVESWLGVPLVPGVMSVVGLAVAFTLVALRLDRKRR